MKSIGEKIQGILLGCEDSTYVGEPFAGVKSERKSEKKISRKDAKLARQDKGSDEPLIGDCSQDLLGVLGDLCERLRFLLHQAAKIA